MNDHELTITRTFDAPRRVVFAAWTEPRHMARWHGPRGFTMTQDKMEIRPGGAYRVCLHAPGGDDHWVRGVYREIVPPEKLVFTHCWEDANGKPGPETLVTIDFVERGDRTEVLFRQTGFGTEASRDGHRTGWSETFDRLAAHLAALPAVRAVAESET
jgi:uncharacterized protein YndB with AHSA1/START domain